MFHRPVAGFAEILARALKSIPGLAAMFLLLAAIPAGAATITFSGSLDVVGSETRCRYAGMSQSPSSGDWTVTCDGQADRRLITIATAFASGQDRCVYTSMVQSPAGDWTVNCAAGGNPPSVVITSPAAGSVHATGQTVTVSATPTPASGRSISKLTFYLDGGATGISRLAPPYSVDYAGLAAGSHGVQVTAQDDLGATASASVSFQVGSSPPTVELATPVSGASPPVSIMVGTSIELAASAAAGPGRTITSVRFSSRRLPETQLAVLGNGTLSAGQYRYSWTPQQPGTYYVAATATDNAGGSASTPEAQVVVTAPANTPTFESVSPASGITVTTSGLTITGTVSEPATIVASGPGGVQTAIGIAFAFPVTLVPGLNTFTLTATNSAGNSSQFVLGITYETAGGAPVVNFESPTDGATFYAPATIQIKADGRSGSGAALPVVVRSTSSVGFEVTTGPSGYAEHTWTNVPEGSYVVTGIVDAGGGVSTTKSITVNVLPDPQDQAFLAIWNGMVGALRAGNKAAALGHLTGNAQQTFSPAFDVLLADMEQIFSSVGTPRRILLSENIAEYAVNRQVDGVQMIFFIYFVKDAQGQWKIDAM